MLHIIKLVPYNSVITRDFCNPNILEKMITSSTIKLKECLHSLFFHSLCFIQYKNKNIKWNHHVFHFIIFIHFFITSHDIQVKCGDAWF